MHLVYLFSVSGQDQQPTSLFVILFMIVPSRLIKFGDVPTNVGSEADEMTENWSSARNARGGGGGGEIEENRGG